MKTNARNFYTGINDYLSGKLVYFIPNSCSFPLVDFPTNHGLVTVTDLLTYSHTNSLPLTTTRLNILRQYRLLQPIMAYPVIWQDKDLDRYLVTESTAKKEIIDHLFTGDWQPRTKLKPLSTSH
jgi:hypothetical protein